VSTAVVAGGWKIVYGTAPQPIADFRMWLTLATMVFMVALMVIRMIALSPASSRSLNIRSQRSQRVSTDQAQGRVGGISFSRHSLPATGRLETPVRR
jgi:hypothetical protein